jgi:hypothetical protein
VHNTELFTRGRRAGFSLPQRWIYLHEVGRQNSAVRNVEFIYTELEGHGFSRAKKRPSPSRFWFAMRKRRKPEPTKFQSGTESPEVSSKESQEKYHGIQR